MRPPPSIEPGKYRSLFDFEDLAWFLEEYPKRTPGQMGLAWEMLGEQAVWLSVLKAFDDYPTLAEIKFEVESADPDYDNLTVATRHDGQDALNAPGTDPHGIDAALEALLTNPNVPTISVPLDTKSRLALYSIQRHTLDEAGEQFIGRHWVIERNRRRLEDHLEPPSTRPTPRL